MIDYRKIIKNRELRLKLIQKLSFVPSSTYLKMVFRIKTGEKLNLKEPVTFCDKQNWLKLHDIHPEYTQLVDKIAVRDYVNNIMGRDMFFPILGKWEKYEDIDFNTLPDQFVLKCNHDSGSVKIIYDKSQMDHKELRKFYRDRLKMDASTIGREYPYHGIKPYVFAEKLMIPQNKKDINDYKFFCFNGKPEILFVATDRSTDCRFDFYDMSFEHLNIINIHPNSDSSIQKPENFEEMKEIASKLSSGMKFVRLDLYDLDGSVYFGEYTFFHGGGFWPMKPKEWEYKLGNLIKL